MNFYNKNLECIKKNRQFMYNSMTKIDNTALRSSNVKSIQTKDGNLALVYKTSVTEYRLNSSYSPINEARTWVKQYEFLNLNNVISLYGFGNGVHVRELIKVINEDDVLLIYEPSVDIFLHVLHNYDITDILSMKKVYVAVDSINEFEYHNALVAVLNYTNMNTQTIDKIPYYDILFPDGFLKFWKELNDTYIHTKINFNTEIAFGERLIENTFNNIKYIKESYTLPELKKNIQTDIPAIIIAGGPSVEVNIDELKNAKGKSVIFAVDRILDFILSHGIEPDFVLTLDPIKPVKYFSSKKDINIPLICFIGSNHEILEQHVGRKIIANCGPFLETVYTDQDKIAPYIISSSSVATFAFSVCIELGFDMIILVGQDLAYSGKQTHAGGVEELDIRDKDIMLDGVNGEKVRSRLDWKEFVTWYEDMAILYPKVKIIDAKTEGALIKGTEVITLKTALEKYGSKEYDISYVSKTMQSTFNDNEIQYIYKYLKDNISTIDEIKKKSKKAISLCNKLLENTVDSSISRKAVKELRKINKYIEEQPIYSLINDYIMANTAEHLIDIYQFSDNDVEDRIKTYKKAINIFASIIKAADFIEPKLEKVTLENDNK